MNSTAKNDLLKKPDNQIHWKPALKKKIPVLRCVHTPPLPKIKLKTIEKERYMGKLGDIVPQLNDAINLVNGTKENDKNDAFQEQLSDLLPNHETWRKVLHSVLIGYCDEHSLDIRESYKKQVTPQMTWLMNTMLGILDTDTVARLWLTEINKLPVGFNACQYYWRPSELSDRFYNCAFNAFGQLRHAIVHMDVQAYESLKQDFQPFLSPLDPYSDKEEGYCIYQKNNFHKQKVLFSLFPEDIPEEHLAELHNYDDWTIYCFNSNILDPENKHSNYERLERFDAYWLFMMEYTDTHDALLTRLQSKFKQENSPALLTVLNMFHTEQNIHWLIENINRKGCEKAFNKFLSSYPVYIFTHLFNDTGIKDTGKSKPNEAQKTAQNIAKSYLVDHPDIFQHLTELSKKHTRELAALTNPEVTNNIAGLPDIFKVRPWNNTKSTKLPVTVETTMSEPSFKEPTSYQFDAYPINDELKNLDKDKTRMILSRAGVERDFLDMAVSEKCVLSHYFGSIYDYDDGIEGIFYLEREFALNIWSHAPVENIVCNIYNEKRLVENALAIFGLDAIPRLIDLSKHKSKAYFPPLINIQSDEIVEIALSFLNKKAVSASALQYLTHHKAATIRICLPIAFSKSNKLKKNALQVLEHLRTECADEGIKNLIDDTAKSYGDDMWQAWQAYKNVPAWQHISTKAPAIPSWLEITRLPALVFKRADDTETTELPSKYMADVVTILMLSGNDIPYAGVDELKKAFTVRSLERVVIAIFDAWLTTNCKKDLWVFYALNWFTSAQTMRKLAKTVRYFVNNSSPSLALDTIDILANYATETKDDMGLVYLNNIASQNGLKNKFREPAQQHIYRIAKLRGLTENELQDRLVPDFGLNERGQKLLDYGTRQFTVKLDETLMPYVVDADNVRLKSIPRLNKNDDKEKATDAKTWYKHFKKDIEKIANQQIKRLEQVMCSGQTWSVSEFENFLVKHPLMTNLCQRIVWGLYDNKQLTQCFRVAEDHSYLTVEDDPLDTLADIVRIGIVHPLFIPEAERKAWGDVFTDYEIIQPVEQLGRQTYAFTPEEIATNALTRFSDNAYYAGSLLSLLSRGWSNEKEVEAMMAGESFITGFSKKVAGAFVGINLDNGFYRDEVKTSKAQKITDISFEELHNTNKETDIKEVRKAELATLQKRNPIQVSEMLRDISLIQTNLN